MGLMTALLRGGDLPGVVGKSVGTAPAAGVIPQLGAAPSATGLLVSQGTAMTVSTVYACVRIRSGSVARCTPRLMRRIKDGEDEVVTDHWLAQLFRRPNRTQTWFECIEMLGAGYLLKGNGYGVLLRQGDGSVREIIPVNPDLVQLLEATDGSLFYQISRAGLWLMAALGEQAVVIPEEDVLHIRDLSMNALQGLSRTGLARDAIGLAMSQEQQAARWAGNGARPAGVLQTKNKLSPETAKRLKAQWDALQSGVQNTGRTAVLEEGLEWHQMQLTSVDLEFLQSRGMQIREVCRFFDTPPHMVGEASNLGQAKLAELNADFVQRVVMGDLCRIEARLDRTFGLDADDELYTSLDHRQLLRADLLTQMTLARQGVLSGLLTQNEGRAQINMGPVAGGDRLLSPVNLAPNGSAVDGTAPDGAGRPPNGEDPPA